MNKWDLVLNTREDHLPNDGVNTYVSVLRKKLSSLLV